MEENPCKDVQVGMNVLPDEPQCGRNLDALLDRIAELEAQNRHDDEADTECRNLLCEELDQAEAQRDRLLVALMCLTRECMASDFNEHWDSFKEAERLLAQFGHVV